MEIFILCFIVVVILSNIIYALWNSLYRLKVNNRLNFREFRKEFVEDLKEFWRE